MWHCASSFTGFGRIRAVPLAIFSCAMGALAWGTGPTVIYSEIASDPTGSVPGALDLNGQPVMTNWLSILDLAMREDGSEWMVRGSTTQGTDLANILVKGSGLSGSAFAQEGQPLLGGGSGAVYDFFDGPRPVAWDTSGNIAFSTRRKVPVRWSTWFAS